MRAKKSFVQLSLSASFFDMCIKTDIETLHVRASELYQLGEFFNEEPHLKNIIAEEQTSKELINEVYTKCIRLISKIPNIQKIIDNEHIKDPSKSDFAQNFSEHLLSMKISEETFKKILKEIPLSMEDKSYEEQTYKIIKELSIKISHEVTPIANEDFKKIPQGILNKTSEDIFEKIMEGLPEILSDKIIRIKHYHYEALE
jgi:signal recognition particle GTPase